MEGNIGYFGMKNIYVGVLVNILFPQQNYLEPRISKRLGIFLITPICRGNTSQEKSLRENNHGKQNDLAILRRFKPLKNQVSKNTPKSQATRLKQFKMNQNSKNAGNGGNCLTAGVTAVVSVEKYKGFVAAQRANFLINLHSIGHVLTGEGWCYVFVTR